MHLATIARQINLLQAYHQTDPELLNLQDDAYGMTPLIWACGEWLGWIDRCMGVLGTSQQNHQSIDTPSLWLP